MTRVADLPVAKKKDILVGLPIVSPEVSGARRAFHRIVKNVTPVTWPAGEEPTSADILMERLKFAEIIRYELFLEGYTQVLEADVLECLFVNAGNDFMGRVTETRLFPIVVNLSKFLARCG